MRMTRQRRQLLRIGAIVAVALSVGAYAADVGVLDQTLQAKAYDYITSSKITPTPPKNQITIVGIDDATIARYGQRWPLPRRAYADALRVLAAMRPTVIGFDLAFYDKSDHPDDDAALAAEIKNAGNVILAMQGVGSQTPVAGALRYDQLQLPIDAIRDAAAGFGAVNIFGEIDSLVRRANLVITDGRERYYALPLVVAAKQLKTDVARLRSVEGALVLSGTLGRAGPDGDRAIPVERAGDMRIYFGVKPATPLSEQLRESQPCQRADEFCVVSLATLVDGKVPDRLIQNRIVLIGAHSASALPDDYPTPNSEEGKMFGVEIWANAAQTILTGRFPLLREDTPTTLLWLALVTVAGVALIARFRLGGFFGALGVLVAYLLVSVVAFAVQIQNPGVVRAPSVAYVAVGAPFWWVVVIAYLQLEEQASVRRTQRAFGLAVTPEVAKHILELEDSGQLALGGQLREATVLFGDIRGFTTMSEGMQPAELMGTLNRYFDGMVQIVQKHGGTVNKYNGDNIMVIWGAPVPIQDHARRAVRCALELQQLVVRERAKGGPDVSFGFGINTGELIAGFLGAQGRFEYTVVGDTVNVASRLTSGDIAKRDNVAVSQRTLQAILPDAEWVDLGHVQVKGRAEPVHCFQVNRVGDLVTPNPAPPPAEPIKAAAVAGYH